MSTVNPSREESVDKGHIPSLQERENRARQDHAPDHAKDAAKKVDLDILYPPRPQIKPRFPVPLTYREIGRGYHPGRGLGYSICFHLFLLVLLLASRNVILDSPRVVIEPREPDQLAKVLYLPVLGGGSEGGGHEGGGSGQTAKDSSGLRARSRRGFAYPGPQPMVSSPPRATLGIQTILQPALKNPPLLKQLLNLPNIVRPAVAPIPELAQQALVVNPGTLTLRQTPEQPIAAPKITLPAAAASAIPDLAASTHTLPESPVVKPAVPRPPDVSDVTTGPRPQEGLLVMNAVPPPPDLTAKIPRAEARSLFAVAPGEATVIAEPAAGAKGGEATSSATGSGSRADLAKGDALAELASGGGAAGHAASGSGSGSGGRYGSGHGSGLNASGNGKGTGRGTGSEAGLGTGSGTSRASGSGAGSAAGTGGFSGMTIQGGRYGNGGNTGSMLSNSKPGYPNSYNMNIVSTGSSGGGLPDFGVFQNEKVYTVYLDMRANDEDPTPSWTLQYAVLQPAAGDSGGSAERIQGTPTPPYATLKEVPEFTPELRRKCGRQLIVASAIIDANGKVEQVTVRKTPETELIGPLVEALEHWIFEPAQIDGRPVALKILLGIRLAAAR